jgi:hypothetical protein
MARTEKKKRSRPHVRRESVRAKGRRWPSTPSTWKTAPQLDVVKDGGFPDGRYPDGSPRSRLLVSRPMTSIRSSPSFDRAPLMTEGGLGDRSESRLRGDAVKTFHDSDIPGLRHLGRFVAFLHHTTPIPRVSPIRSTLLVHF